MIERLTFRLAHKVIANTDRLAMMWEQRHPRWKHKISVIWNGYDPQEEIAPLAFPPRHARVLAHIGNIYEGRTPLPVLSSLERLMRSGRIRPSDLQVQLIGILQEGSLTLTEDPCRTLIEQRILECSHDALPQHEARRLMCQADFLLLLDINGVSEGLQVPAKIFEYIRVGRPILAFTAKGSPVEQILANSGVPHVCVYPNMPPDEMDTAIREFLDLPSTPVAPSRSFVETFDGIHQTETLAREFDTLIGRAVLRHQPSTTAAETIRP